MTIFSLLDQRMRYRVCWIGLGVLALIVSRVFKHHPEWAESIYGKGLFPVIRYLYDYTLGLLPFPVLWIVTPVALWYLWRSALRPMVRKQVTGVSFVTGLLSTAGAVLFMFYFLWGFNYTRYDVGTRMELVAPPLEMEQLKLEFTRATQELVASAATAGDVVRVYLTETPGGLESEIRNATEAVIQDLGMPVPGRVRGRLLSPKGALLCFNTAGIYIPFTNEGHVDAGMLSVQVPFTMSHEMAHGLGVTDEGDCNFLAYLACTRSPDPFIRFSGLLSYWRYAAAEYRRVFPEEYKMVYESLPDVVRQCLIEIRKNLDKYPEIMPKLRNLVYDSYLKSHGVHEGLRSYSRIVRMVSAYRNTGSAAE